MPLLILFTKIRTLYCFLIIFLVREWSSVVGGPTQGGSGQSLVTSALSMVSLPPARRRGHRMPCPCPAFPQLKNVMHELNYIVAI